MKKILLLTLCILSFSKIHSQGLIDVPEVWEIDQWSGTEWNLISRTTYTFNTNCLAIQGLAEFIDIVSGSLQNASQLFITYNSNDLPIESVNQIWDATNEAWEFNLKSEFLYNGTDLSETLNYTYVDDNWLLTDRILLSYTGPLVTTVTYQDRDVANTVWTNNSKEEHSYNPDNSISETINYNWDETIPDWVNNHRVIYTYSDGLLITKESDNWESNSWVNNDLETYMYDSNDFLVETLEQDWNGANYQDKQRILRTNNEEGNPTEMINETWLGAIWFPTTRDRRTYPTCSTLSVSENMALDFKVYPNPTSDKIDINFGHRLYGNILIADLNGKTIYTQKVNSEHITIDVTKFPTGVYFLSIENDTTKMVKKVIKM